MKWRLILQRNHNILEQHLAYKGPQLRLNLRNLYILPTAFGGLWLIGTTILYLVGIYSNSNGPTLLAFLCSGLFLQSIFLTHFNLQGLELLVEPPQPGFAGSYVKYPMQLRSHFTRHCLRIGFKGAPLQILSVVKKGTTPIQIPWIPTGRGLQKPGRLKLYSKAPLGLFVCWSIWEPSMPQLIYPSPLAGPVLETWDSDQESRSINMRKSQSDSPDTFRELSPHRAEEGLQKIAWKQVARGRGWLAKRFELEASNNLMHLSPDPGVELEMALQHLCARVLELNQRNQPFVLEIPGVEPIPCGRGRIHSEAVLRALALA